MIDLSLIAACAPAGVSVQTIADIIRVESAGQPFALQFNVPGGKGVAVVLSSAPEARAFLASADMKPGMSVDIGLMQINNRELPRLGLTLDDALDPCKNIWGGATLLQQKYVVALETHNPGQDALSAALSAYNTGSFARGFTNGYVGHYYQSVGARPVRGKRPLSGPIIEQSMDVFHRESPPPPPTVLEDQD